MDVSDPVDWQALDALCPPLPAGRRVGLLGGSFNPPHLGHALLGLSVLATEPLDALWVLPSADHPFGKEMVPFEHRRAMCEAAFSRLGGAVAVVPIEAHLPTPNYTADTLKALHRVRPGIETTFVMGSDLLLDWPRWHDTQSILELARIVVVQRQGFDVDRNLLPEGDVGWHPGIALPELASAQVRTTLSAGLSVDGLLDRDVLAYIREHDLYGPSVDRER